MLGESPPRRRRSRAEGREDNRKALLAAAREIIVEVGYGAAQLEAIAERAGLTKGAIYSIFGGKMELLRAVVDAHAREVLPLLGWQFDLPPAVTSEDLVERLVRNYLTFLDREDTERLLAFELDLNGLVMRDAATRALVVGHEHEFAGRLAAALAGRRRLGGRPLDEAAAADAADLVLGALGGIGQRLVTSPWMTRDPDVIVSARCVSVQLPRPRPSPRPRWRCRGSPAAGLGPRVDGCRRCRRRRTRRSAAT
jgi:AcrR family transcriptional regulator